MRDGSHVSHAPVTGPRRIACVLWRVNRGPLGFSVQPEGRLRSISIVFKKHSRSFARFASDFLFLRASVSPCLREAVKKPNLSVSAKFAGVPKCIPIFQASFIGHLNDKFFVAKPRYIFDSWVFSQLPCLRGRCLVVASLRCVLCVLCIADNQIRPSREEFVGLSCASTRSSDSRSFALFASFAAYFLFLRASVVGLLGSFAVHQSPNSEKSHPKISNARHFLISGNVRRKRSMEAANFFGTRPHPVRTPTDLSQCARHAISGGSERITSSSPVTMLNSATASTW